MMIIKSNQTRQTSSSWNFLLRHQQISGIQDLIIQRTRHMPSVVSIFLFIILLNINPLISIIVATAIKSTVPDCEIVFNKVPKIHAMAEIYCQLIPNDDDIRDFEIVPR